MPLIDTYFKQLDFFDLYLVRLGHNSAGVVFWVFPVLSIPWQKVPSTAVPAPTNTISPCEIQLIFTAIHIDAWVNVLLSYLLSFIFEMLENYWRLWLRHRPTAWGGAYSSAQVLITVVEEAQRGRKEEWNVADICCNLPKVCRCDGV